MTTRRNPLVDVWNGIAQIAERLVAMERGLRELRDKRALEDRIAAIERRLGDTQS